MTLAQALAYFFREAFLNLVRSWKVSLLAILTIAVSLFLGGVFLLVSSNLQRVLQQWQSESKVVIYLESGTSADARQALKQKISKSPWLDNLEEVSSETARQRFTRAFPSMTGLLDGWGEDPLPTSLELSIDWRQLDRPTAEAWLEALHTEPAVAMVDDDRDWLGQLKAAALILQGLGLVLGGVLLGTAVFTIASIIRLTAYLYRDEIAIMRQVGATEFFIRGPFYMEGLFQGLTGGLVAVTTLFLAHTSLRDRYHESLIASLLAADFLSARHLLTLIALGGGAGLIGAITSLRRESLAGPGEENEDWAA